LHLLLPGDQITRIYYKQRKISGHGNFETLFPKRIKRLIKMRLWLYYTTTHCSVVSPYTVGNHAYPSRWVCVDRTEFVLS